MSTRTAPQKNGKVLPWEDWDNAATEDQLWWLKSRLRQVELSLEQTQKQVLALEAEIRELKRGSRTRFWKRLFG